MTGRKETENPGIHYKSIKTKDERSRFQSTIPYDLMKTELSSTFYFVNTDRTHSYYNFIHPKVRKLPYKSSSVIQRVKISVPTESDRQTEKQTNKTREPPIPLGRVHTFGLQLEKSPKVCNQTCKETTEGTNRVSLGNMVKRDGPGIGSGVRVTVGRRTFDFPRQIKSFTSI